MPGAVSRLLRFSRLPSRAVATVLNALDESVEFRELVAQGLDEDEPDRVSWLFLARPEGWLEELRVLLDLASEELQRASTDSLLRETQRHLEATRSTLEATRADLSAADRRIDELEGNVTVLRSELADREAAVARLESAVDRLQEARDRAVADLKRTERHAADRLERIRELERLVESGPSTASPPAPSTSETGDSTAAETAVDTGDATTADTGDATVDEDGGELPWPMGTGIDRAALAESFGAALEALRQLTTALGSAATSIGLGEVASTTASSVEGPGRDGGDGSRIVDAADPDSTRVDEDEGARTRAVARRTPIRLLRGAIEGSVDGIGQLLETPGVVVLVDGYNVAMEAWPSLSKTEQRDSLVRMAGALASRWGADIHLVFDGTGDGSRPNVGAALPVRVHFSDADTEADDVILDMVASIAGPIVVVTSDRRILDGSRRLGANVITSTQIIEFVRGATSGRIDARK